jgi:hypothetical protein
MKQIESKKTITWSWWTDDNEIIPEHIPALEEAADNRITQAMEEGFTSGELNENIRMTDDDPEDGVPYRGAWKVSTETNNLD